MGDVSAREHHPALVDAATSLLAHRTTDWLQLRHVERREGVRQVEGLLRDEAGEHPVHGVLSRVPLLQLLLPWRASSASLCR